MPKPDRDADSRPFTVVCLLNTRLWDRTFVAGQEPNPRLMWDEFTRLGIRVRHRPMTRFPFNPLERRGSFYAGLDVLRALRVLLFDRDADAILAVGESSPFVVLLLAGLLRFRVPVVLREVSALGWPVRDRVMAFVMKRVARLDLLTEHQMRTVPPLFPLRRAPWLSGMAVDQSFFRPDGGRGEDDLIVAVGDDHGRDYATLVEACRTLPFRLVLRTDAPPPIPAEMRDRVRVRGRVPFTELRALYSSAAMVVVPVRRADHPSGITSVLEGMAMGRTVLTSGGNSVGGIVEHGRTGLVCAAEDAGALRDAIRAAMSDPALRARLGQAARQEVEGRLSHLAFSERVAANLREVAALCRRGG